MTRGAKQKKKTIDGRFEWVCGYESNAKKESKNCFIRLLMIVGLIRQAARKRGEKSVDFLGNNLEQTEYEKKACKKIWL